jgi:hypothetical protein
MVLEQKIAISLTFLKKEMHKKITLIVQERIISVALIDFFSESRSPLKLTVHV